MTIAHKAGRGERGAPLTLHRRRVERDMVNLLTALGARNHRSRHRETCLKANGFSRRAGVPRGRCTHGGWRDFLRCLDDAVGNEGQIRHVLIRFKRCRQRGTSRTSSSAPDPAEAQGTGQLCHHYSQGRMHVIRARGDGRPLLCTSFASEGRSNSYHGRAKTQALGARSHPRSYESMPRVDEKPTRGMPVRVLIPLVLAPKKEV